MRAVANCVSVLTTNSVEAKGSTSAKLRVGNDDTTINDVGVCVLTSGSIVRVGGEPARAGGDGSEAPSRTSLGRQSFLLELCVSLLVPKVRDGVRLNKSNLELGD